MPKITKRVVDSAAAPDGNRLLLWDDELKGFGLLVLPSGVKTYIANYRVAGRLQRQTIGRHGVLTPEQARDRARKILVSVADGKDPVAEERENLSAKMTVAELVDLYLTEGPVDRPNKKPSTWATDRSNLTRHVIPLLGKRPVRSLMQSEIAKFQADVAAGRNKADVKTKERGRAIIAGGPGAAARSLGTLSAVLSWAVGRELIDTNPAKGVPLLKLQDAAELSRNAATAIKLLAMTGCRKGEILGLKWAWVDFEHGLLRLPDSKTGQKAVALGASALALLADLPREGEYLLPAGRGNTHYTGLGKDWRRVRERADLADFRVHDLRHAFASFAVADGASLYIVGKALGHTQSRTTERYAHLAQDPVRAVAERVAARVAAASKRGRPATEVVPIRKG
jgi:integrase